MKRLEFIDKYLRHDWEGPGGTNSLKQEAHRLVAELLDELLPLGEATVHRARRSKIWIASFTGAAGGQTWKSTGTTDYGPAVKMAKRWEAEARAQRATLGSTASKTGIRVRRPGGEQLSQKEVAQILRMSERGVRAVEHQALQKLRNHPDLKHYWQRYVSGEPIEEGSWILTSEEIAALFSLARTHEEIQVIEKLVRIVQP